MNKTLLLAIIIGITLFFFGCSENNPSQDNREEFESLNNSIESILSINSLSYVSLNEQNLKTNDDTITIITTTENKRIDEPFVIWSKVQKTESHANEQTNETTTELYQASTEKGLEMFYRIGDMEWTKNTTMKDPTMVNQYIEQSNNFLKACYYLLNTNLDSFELIENQEGLLKFSGFISQSSVVEAYEKYYREFFVNGGLIKESKELPSKDELLEEITSGNIYELMNGIPSLAFSDKSTPITIWVNTEDNEISKVEIDEIDVTKAIANKSFEGADSKVPEVEKSILTYDILEINTIDEISMPE